MVNCEFMPQQSVYPGVDGSVFSGTNITLNLIGGDNVTLGSTTALDGSGNILLDVEINAAAGSGSTPGDGGIFIAEAGSTITNGTVLLLNANNISLDITNGTQLQAIPNYGTGVTDITNTNSSGSTSAGFALANHQHKGVHLVADGNGASLFGDIQWTNSNGFVVYSTVGNKLVGSYSVPAVPLAGTGILDVNSLNSSGTDTFEYAAVDHVHKGVHAIEDGASNSLFGDVLFANTNRVSFGTSAGNKISASFELPQVYMIEPTPMIQTAGGLSAAAFHFKYFYLPGFMTLGDVNGYLSCGSGGANQSQNKSISLSVGIYTKTGVTLNLLNSASGSTTITSNSRSWLEVPITTWSALSTLSPGNYWMAAAFSFGTSSNSEVSMVGYMANPVFAGAHASQSLFNAGSYGTTSNTPPATLQLSDIVVTGANAQRFPYLWVNGLEVGSSSSGTNQFGGTR